ncbi:hypothetical protein EDB84DRAFT_1669690 [Lactarius hengduanensis]|nr:hypothetical protein EDB84DRAFT_1669690 [Lactarius hengduanensis]
MDDFLPDLSLRQSSAVALIPLSLTYYALGVLAILPNTFLFRLLLQPVSLWQAWGCITNIDFSAWLAQSRGLQNSDSLAIWNSSFMVRLLFTIVFLSFEWTFIIKVPIRKYELTTDQDAPTRSKKPLSISSITMFDASRYRIQLVCPAVSSSPSGGSIFDPNLSLLPRIASAVFAGICGGIWTYLLVETMYHMAALIGRLVCRQPGSHWPPISHRPWLSTSLHEFWSYRWHQLPRHIFVTFGARPGGALLGQPGALMGAFAVSAVLHHFAMWGIGNGSEFSTVGFKKVMGMRVGGFFGWLWTTLWVIGWGIFLIDTWARHGMLASEIFPTGLRPGKPLVDGVISLLNICRAMFIESSSSTRRPWLLGLC